MLCFPGEFFDVAGANYQYSSNPSTGSVGLSMDVAYALGAQAHFWINTDWSWITTENIIATDPQFRNFTSVRCGNVWERTLRATPGRGNDFYETGVVRPDLILKDIVKILHPQRMEQHQFFFYKNVLPVHPLSGVTVEPCPIPPDDEPVSPTEEVVTDVLSDERWVAPVAVVGSLLVVGGVAAACFVHRRGIAMGREALLSEIEHDPNALTRAKQSAAAKTSAANGAGQNGVPLDSANAGAAAV